MNCASARCSRASAPRITTKRAPEMRLGGLEIELPEPLAELDMIARLEAELARLP